MKFEMMKRVTFDAIALRAEMQVRYWEDAVVNGVEDEDGSKIPGRKGDIWYLHILLETGQITSWPKGTTAKVHYKVCDAGVYTLIDDNGSDIVTRNDYVPAMLGPEGYGDYVIMDIDENGLIKNWKPDLDYFNTDD